MQNKKRITETQKCISRLTNFNDANSNVAVLDG